MMGEISVGKRYYSLEYTFHNELRGEGISMDVRIRIKPRIEIVEEISLANDGCAVSDTKQEIVKLGDTDEVKA